jgi:hypothetical protein
MTSGLIDNSYFHFILASKNSKELRSGSSFNIEVVLVEVNNNYATLEGQYAHNVPLG